MKFCVRALVAALLSALGLMLLGSVPAHACTFTPRAPSKYLEAADASFAGSVAALDQTGEGPIVATFAVGQVFKGDLPEVVMVSVPAATKDCGVGFVPGRIYTVFLKIKDGTLTTDLRRGTASGNAYLTEVGIEPIKVYTEGPLALADPSPPATSGGRAGPIAAAVLVLMATAGGLFWRAKRHPAASPPG